jgi:hypothetical protein
VGNLKFVDQLMLPAMAQDSPDAERNRHRVESALQGKCRMLIIAPLASYSPEREQRMTKDLVIAGFHGIPKAFMRHGQWELLSKRYRAAVAGWNAGQTAVVIAQVEVKERDGRRSANVIDAALMAVTQQWIPTESSHQRLIAEKLVSEGRSFNKPLLYNEDEDYVFPDFVLTDCARGGADGSIRLGR